MARLQSIGSDLVAFYTKAQRLGNLDESPEMYAEEMLPANRQSCTSRRLRQDAVAASPLNPKPILLKTDWQCLPRQCYATRTTLTLESSLPDPWVKVRILNKTFRPWSSKKLGCYLLSRRGDDSDSFFEGWSDEQCDWVSKKDERADDIVLVRSCGVQGELGAIRFTIKDLKEWEACFASGRSSRLEVESGRISDGGDEVSDGEEPVKASKRAKKNTQPGGSKKSKAATAPTTFISSDPISEPTAHDSPSSTRTSPQLTEGTTLALVRQLHDIPSSPDLLNRFDNRKVAEAVNDYLGTHLQQGTGASSSLHAHTPPGDPMFVGSAVGSLQQSYMPGMGMHPPTGVGHHPYWPNTMVGPMQGGGGFQGAIQPQYWTGAAPAVPQATGIPHGAYQPAYWPGMGMAPPQGFGGSQNQFGPPGGPWA